MLVDRFNEPLHVCTDPECEWAALSPERHFARHNEPCARLFIATDGTELICERTAGHEPPCRGTARRSEGLQTG